MMLRKTRRATAIVGSYTIETHIWKGEKLEGLTKWNQDFKVEIFKNLKYVLEPSNEAEMKKGR